MPVTYHLNETQKDILAYLHQYGSNRYVNLTSNLSILDSLGLITVDGSSGFPVATITEKGRMVHEEL